jgi:hypothetical protein
MANLEPAPVGTGRIRPATASIKVTLFSDFRVFRQDLCTVGSGVHAWAEPQGPNWADFGGGEVALGYPFNPHLFLLPPEAQMYILGLGFVAGPEVHDQ